nr:EAL domain-containing protein [Pyrinomonadaceae bacterium]
PIGWWVLHEACRQMRQWQLRYSARRTLKLSVNLSGKQLSQTDAVERIKQIMELTDFDPHQLNLEITESALIENTDGVTLMLTQLRALGVRLSMDDFGTGYSSLSYLHRFPLNTLKIDRSFISQMSASDKTAIVHTIILLAQNLGMNVIAEGVETSEQMELLRALNCDYGQGYLFSPPVDAAAVAELLQARQHYCDVGGALVSEVGRQ